MRGLEWRCLRSLVLIQQIALRRLALSGGRMFPHPAASPFDSDFAEKEHRTLSTVVELLLERGVMVRSVVSPEVEQKLRQQATP